MSTVTLPREGDAAERAPRTVRQLPAHPIAWLTLGAIALRLLLFLGRGDYVAFDEAWYLVLGRNLWSGHGYTMSGLRHVALSPLFPIVAGLAGRLLGNAVWGGRVVAAVASGLLVLPAWAIARRLAGRRTALLMAAMVAVLPSLAPFVAPKFVGWDLWVGAGPLFLLFLFSAIAFGLGGLAGRPWWYWPLAGLGMGLAYLDRPEAIAVFGISGLLLLGLAARRRAPRLLAGAALAAGAFLATTAPYLFYLHGTLGRWALTGRGVAVNVSAVRRTITSGKTSSAATIEDMLWHGQSDAYVDWLYRLDPSDAHMADTYWGVPPRSAPPSASGQAHLPQAVQSRAEHPDSAAGPGPGTSTSSGNAAARDNAPAPPSSRAARTGERLRLYAKALGMVVPLFLWPLALLGLLAPGRRRRRELLFFPPVAITGVLVAALVAIDPRTQLLLALPLAFYAARGLRLVGVYVDRRVPRSQMHRGFAFAVLSMAALLVLLGTDLHRLWMGAMHPYTRQFVATAERQVGAAVRATVPAGEKIMSFDPSIAVWAGRDWVPLPVATLPRIIRYARATHVDYVVFSTLNPSPVPKANMPRAFALLRLTPGVDDAERVAMRIARVEGQYVVGDLVRAPDAPRPLQRDPRAPLAPASSHAAMPPRSSGAGGAR